MDSLATAPLLKDLTITPSIAAAYDYRYMDKYGVLAPGRETRTWSNILYGLDVTLDVTKALDVSCCSFTIRRAFKRV